MFPSTPTVHIVTKNGIVFSTLTVVCCVFAIVSIVIFLYRRHFDYNRATTTNSSTTNRVRAVNTLGAVNTITNLTSFDNTIRSIENFYESIFPDEFRQEHWLKLYLESLNRYHIWYSTLLRWKEFTLRKWFYLFIRLLSFIFFGTLFTDIIYRRNSCDDYDTKWSCIDYSSSVTSQTHYLDYHCEWSDVTESCEFHQPHLTFINVLIFSAIISVAVLAIFNYVVAVVDAIVVMNEHRFATTITSMRTKAGESNEESSRRSIDLELQMNDGETLIVDEFILAQTFRSNMLRAARLAKMQKTIDFTSDLEESTFLTIKTSESLVENTPMHLLSYRRARYGFDKIIQPVIWKRVQKARAAADKISTEMKFFRTAQEQEEHLMKHFIIDVLQRSQRDIASHFLKVTVPWVWRIPDESKRISLGVFLLGSVIAIVLCLIGFTLILGAGFDLKAAKFWATVTFTAVLIDIVLILPVKILLYHVLLPSHVSADIRSLFRRLSKYSRIILMRTSGVMRDSNAFVQYFNPACRVARTLPHLPISRLLISVGDQDIPQRIHQSWLEQFYLAFLMVVNSVYVFPPILQQFCIDIVVAMKIYLLMIGFYYFGKRSPVGAFVLFLGLVAIVFFFEIIVLVQRRRIIHRQKVLESQKLFDIPHSLAVEGTDDDQLSFRNPFTFQSRNRSKVYATSSMNYGHAEMLSVIKSPLEKSAESANRNMRFFEVPGKSMRSPESSAVVEKSVNESKDFTDNEQHKDLRRVKGPPLSSVAVQYQIDSLMKINHASYGRKGSVESFALTIDKSTDELARNFGGILYPERNESDIVTRARNKRSIQRVRGTATEYVCDASHQETSTELVEENNYYRNEKLSKDEEYQHDINRRKFDMKPETYQTIRNIIQSASRKEKQEEQDRDIPAVLTAMVNTDAKDASIPPDELHLKYINARKTQRQIVDSSLHPDEYVRVGPRVKHIVSNFGHTMM